MIQWIVDNPSAAGYAIWLAVMGIGLYRRSQVPINTSEWTD